MITNRLPTFVRIRELNALSRPDMERAAVRLIRCYRALLGLIPAAGLLDLLEALRLLGWETSSRTQQRRAPVEKTVKEKTS